MATEQELARFRRLTNLTDEDETYTDALIDGLIEDLTFDVAVTAVWKEKAAQYAGLVDMTESGSTRRLSQLYEQALKMGSAIGGVVEESTGGSSYTVEIERI